MINVSDSYKQKFYDGTAICHFSIKVTDEDGSNAKYYKDEEIVDGSLNISSGLQSGSDIDFIGCVSSTAEFKIYRKNIDLKDKKVSIDLEVEKDYGTREVLTIFTGKIDSSKPDSATSIVTTVTAYDALNKVLDDKDVTEWYDGMYPEGTETRTVEELRKSLLEHLGIPYANQTLINDDQAIKKGVDTSKKENEEGDEVYETVLTAATVLQCLCEINASFGQINGYGEFRFVSLPNINATPQHPTAAEVELFSDEGLINIECEESLSDEITGVVIFDATSEEYEETGEAIAYWPEDKEKIEGDDANAFKIENNFLMNGQAQESALEMAKRIYDAISYIRIAKCTLDAVYYPWLECGDPIAFVTPAVNDIPQKTYNTYILKRTISGTSLIKDQIESQFEEVSSNIESISEVINAERFYRKIGDEKLYSEIEQTKREIYLKVSDVEAGLESKIDIQSGRIDLVVERFGGENSAITTRIIMTESTLALHAEKIEIMGGRVDIVARDMISLQSSLIDIQADVVNIKASRVTFEDLQTGGRTTINGANIITGSIDASKIKTGVLEADKIQADQIDVTGLISSFRTTTITATGITSLGDVRAQAFYLQNGASSYQQLTTKLVTCKDYKGEEHEYYLLGYDA